MLKDWWRNNKHHHIYIYSAIVFIIILIAFSLTVHWFGWDWLQILGVLAIPVLAAIGGVWFTGQLNRVSEERNRLQNDTDILIAADQQREAALQGYLDKMSDLLLVKGLRNSSISDEVRTMARTRTWTVLRILDPDRRGILFRFLYESNLISTIDLSKANFSGAELSGADLSGAKLSQADLSKTKLREINLIGVDLSEANISGADLSGADLSGAKLTQADLSAANLSQAVLDGADLTRVDLHGANLMGASFKGATLSGASFTNANFTGADLGGINLIEAKDLSETRLDNVKGLTQAEIDAAKAKGAIFFDH
jgi:uncharacterized protein YjbI with pentapeptide repeats